MIFLFKLPEIITCLCASLWQYFIRAFVCSAFNSSMTFQANAIDGPGWTKSFVPVTFGSRQRFSQSFVAAVVVKPLLLFASFANSKLRWALPFPISFLHAWGVFLYSSQSMTTYYVFMVEFRPNFLVQLSQPSARLAWLLHIGEDPLKSIEGALRSIEEFVLIDQWPLLGTFSHQDSFLSTPNKPKSADLLRLSPDFSSASCLSHFSSAFKLCHWWSLQLRLPSATMFPNSSFLPVSNMSSWRPVLVGLSGTSGKKSHRGTHSWLLAPLRVCFCFSRHQDI